jgi:hypothetical protein
MSDRIDLRFIWKDCAGDYDLMQRRIDRVLYDLRAERENLLAQIEFWTEEQYCQDTHTARLLDIQPIKGEKT